ncbi:MAG: carboxylating nicotinate-nucleotide diphosphorylase [Chloroflexota bacterium]
MFDTELASHIIELALREDLGEAGDLTSKSTLSDDVLLRGRIVAKADGVIAGLPIVEMVYGQVDPTVSIHLSAHDGQHVTSGTLIAEVEGKGQSILTGERVALNFLQRLSGIATLTAQFVGAVKDTKTVILDTRKTTPGWRLLEKYAVKQGGGDNHRIGLYDMVLIKDNHIDGAGSITAAVNAVRDYPQAAQVPIEVEVRNLDELREVLSLKVDRVLLDNMTDDQMREAVTITNGSTKLEASGNMNLQRVATVAATGVDYISVGALTHSAPALDLSMKIVRL